MTDPINLLYIIYSMNNGGAETLAIRLAEMIDKDLFHTTVCSLSDAGPLREVLFEKKIPFVTLGKKEGKDLHIVPRLRRLFRERMIDMIHTHNQGPLLYTCLATLLTRKYKIVHTEHIDMFKEFSYSKKHILYNNLLYRKLDGFVSIARHLTENFKTRYDLRGMSVATIHNSVEITNPPAQPAISLRKEIHVGNDAILIGNISALREQKDHATLIRSMKIVVRQKPNTFLIIAGDGEMKEELQMLSHQLGIADHIIFLGYRPDVNELLSQFDLFALSSLYEGLPLCILEAMAAAKPIVATNAEGTEELIRDNVTGSLVPTKDARKFAEAVIRIIDNPVTSGEMGRRARALVLKEYNIKTMIQAYEEYYQHLFHA